KRRRKLLSMFKLIRLRKKDVREGVRKKRRVRIVNPVQPTSEHVSSPTPLNYVVPLTTIAGEAHVIPPMSAGWYCSGRFGNLPFTPQWGLTESSRMDNSRQCRDMMSNLFTPADLEFFNEGVRHESTVKRSWKMLCQSAQHQANVLLHFGSLMEEHADLVYAHESCNDVKIRYKECKRELAKAQSAYDEKVLACDQLSKNYDRALIHVKSLQERVEELEEEKREAEQLTSEQADHIKHLEEALKQSEVEAQQLRLDKENMPLKLVKE
ncbi:hypothetical protein Tco_0130826, partial [Tanacetum coccineum]